MLCATFCIRLLHINCHNQQTHESGWRWSPWFYTYTHTKTHNTHYTHSHTLQLNASSTSVFVLWEKSVPVLILVGHLCHIFQVWFYTKGGKSFTEQIKDKPLCNQILTAWIILTQSRARPFHSANHTTVFPTVTKSETTKPQQKLKEEEKCAFVSCCSGFKDWVSQLWPLCSLCNQESNIHHCSSCYRTSSLSRSASPPGAEQVSEKLQGKQEKQWIVESKQTNRKMSTESEISEFLVLLQKPKRRQETDVESRFFSEKVPKNLSNWSSTTLEVSVSTSFRKC